LTIATGERRPRRRRRNDACQDSCRAYYTFFPTAPRIQIFTLLQRGIQSIDSKIPLAFLSTRMDVRTFSSDNLQDEGNDGEEEEDDGDADDKDSSEDDEGDAESKENEKGVDEDTWSKQVALFGNDDSLTLPPNPDIPPPKKRVTYPIQPPPRQQQRNKGIRVPPQPTSLINDRLVAHLVKKRRHQSATANTIQVRVVPDPLSAKVKTAPDKESAPVDKANKPKSAVMSLTEAIQLSIKEEKDLVEISLDQEVPVVTISNFSSIAYQNNKAKKESKSSMAVASQLKEVTMQAGIADNDLQRKVNDILKFTEKGYACAVSIRASRKHTRVNENAAHDAVQRVLHLIRDHVEMVLEPEISPSKNMAQFRVRNKKK
jgi:translation initiation factor IF-3